MSELNDEFLRLKLDKEALAAELRTSGSKQPKEVVEKRMEELLVTSIGVVENLLLHSDSDSVRANLAKWIIDRKLDFSASSVADRELAKLLGELTAQ